MTDETGPIIAVVEGPATAKATGLAVDLVAEVTPIVWEHGGWPSVAGMSCTMLFRALAAQQGFCSGSLITGLASALANTFTTMDPRTLREFVVGLEQEAYIQFQAKAQSLRVVEPEGEA
jgi:acid phosphatase family membrane protein YuiD